MADKTMVEKAGEAVGFGIALAEDVAGAVKTAVGAAVTTVTKVLKKDTREESSVSQKHCPENSRKAGHKEGRC